MSSRPHRCQRITSSVAVRKRRRGQMPQVALRTQNSDREGAEVPLAATYNKEKPALKKNSIGKNKTADLTTPALEAILAAHKGGEPVSAGLTIGPDLGDRGSCYCVLDQAGEVIGLGNVAQRSGRRWNWHSRSFLPVWWRWR